MKRGQIYLDLMSGSYDSDFFVLIGVTDPFYFIYFFMQAFLDVENANSPCRKVILCRNGNQH